MNTCDIVPNGIQVAADYQTHPLLMVPNYTLPFRNTHDGSCPASARLMYLCCLCILEPGEFKCIENSIADSTTLEADFAIISLVNQYVELCYNHADANARKAIQDEFARICLLQPNTIVPYSADSIEYIMGVLPYKHITRRVNDKYITIDEMRSLINRLAYKYPDDRYFIINGFSYVDNIVKSHDFFLLRRPGLKGKDEWIRFDDLLSPNGEYIQL